MFLSCEWRNVFYFGNNTVSIDVMTQNITYNNYVLKSPSVPFHSLSPPFLCIKTMCLIFNTPTLQGRRFGNFSQFGKLLEGN